MTSFELEVVRISELLSNAHIPFTANQGKSFETFAFQIDLSKYFRGLRHLVWGIVYDGVPEELLSFGAIERVRYILSSQYHVSDVDIVVIFWKGEPYTANSLLPKNWALLNAEELVTKAPNDLLSLNQLIRHRVALTKLNPYRSEGFVSNSMFFGRDSEVDDLCALGGEPKSYVVLGPRRAGKTSLALRLRDRFRNNPEMRESIRARAVTEERYLYYSSYVDLDKIHDVYDIWDLILAEMGLEARDYRSGYAMRLAPGSRREVAREPHDLLANLLQNKYRKSVIILDEVDKFLRMDRESGWSETSKLRVIAQNLESRTRVIMLGYEDLHRYMRDTSFPFHGKVHEKRLSHLKEPNAVSDLIQLPMEELGITFTRQREIVDLIDRAAGSNPSLIQEVCRRLVDSLDDMSDRHLVPSAVSALLNSEGGAIVARHYEAFAAMPKPFPKLLAYISVHDKHLAVKDYRNKLKSRFELLLDDSEIKSALERLYLNNVLDFSDNQYYFANEMLRERLRADLIDDQMLVPHLVDLVRARGTSS